MDFTYHITVQKCVGILQAAEAAMVLGFHSLSQNFPVTRTEADVCTVTLKKGSSLSAGEAEDGILVTVPETASGTDVAELLDAYLKATGRALHQNREIEMPEDFAPALDGGNKVQPPARDWRGAHGLENLFEVGGLFLDRDGDQLADACDFHVQVPASPEEAMYRGILDLAYRLGMETTAYASPLFCTEDVPGRKIRVETADRCGIRQEENGDVTVFGSGEEFAGMCSRIFGIFPLEKPGTDLVEFLCALVEGSAWGTPDGQMAAAAAEKAGDPDSIFFGGPELAEKGLGNYQELTPVFTKEYTFPWETDVLTGILKEKLLPRVQPGDRVTVLGAVSENKNVRAKLRETVETMLPGCQADILCAYKQGFSWLEEWVLPRLRGMDFSQPEDGITIAFKPFLPEGVTDWGQEQGGAVPTYYGGTNASPDKWLDLPIRFLQELYPVDEILCRELNLTREQIHFVTYDGEETYQLSVRSGGEELDQVWHYSVPVMERRYLDDFPHLGLVHPAVGYVKAWINGQPVVDETFLTDPEQLWEKFQQEVLPETRAFVDNKCGPGLSPKDQPLFAQLRLEAWLSEPDEELDTREDLLSSLDALHEDLYFAGSDYFKTCGLKSQAGQPLDAPGLILPVIHQREGAPVFRVSLYERRFQAPCAVHQGVVSYAPWNKHQAEITIREIGYDHGWVTFYLKTACPDGTRMKAFLTAYGKLLEGGQLEASTQLLPGTCFVAETEAGTVNFTMPDIPEPEKSLDIRDVEIKANELMGYDEYLGLMEQLKRVPGLHVYILGRSCEGRLIYGVEVASKRKGYLSRTKRVTRSISEMLTARHHANEVSSTNAAFMLIRDLLTEERYADLPEWLNLIIIPMLNTDGAAIHYELQKEHPKWKFHVARYNALGREHGREWFVPDTIHTEALAHRKLWWDILPDIEVDNHGVPSHEWEQQFSGYTSPSFKGFWLPRSLLYGYFWYVTNPEYKSNMQIDHRMEEVIADVVNADPEITRWNRDWQERFETYAHGWMPGLFPADYYQNMINYWVAYPYTPGHTYDSVKFPWITTVCYTSEVADETAQGEYLALCARTHLLHDHAILALLREGRSVYRQETVRKDNTVFFSMTRQRPALCLQTDEH